MALHMCTILQDRLLDLKKGSCAQTFLTKETADIAKTIFMNICQLSHHSKPRCLIVAAATSNYFLTLGFPMFTVQP
jgi:hypothetical protein